MKKKLLSDAIDETIEYMVYEHKNNIINAYTLEIEKIFLTSKHLYTSFDAKSISDRANKYIAKNNAKVRDKNVIINLKNRSDLLDFMCFDLIDKYVNIKKLAGESDD